MSTPALAPPIPSSIAKPVKAWLYSTLATAFTGWVCDQGAPLLVCYDEPGSYLPNDVVSVRGVHRRLDRGGMVGTMGAGALFDVVDVTVAASIFRGGDDPQRTWERAADVADAIVAAIRTDPTAGGAALVVEVADCEITEAAWTDDHKGRLATATLTVVAKGFI